MNEYILQTQYNNINLRKVVAEGNKMLFMWEQTNYYMTTIYYQLDSWLIYLLLCISDESLLLFTFVNILCYLYTLNLFIVE